MRQSHVLDAPAVLAWLRQHVASAAHLCLDSRTIARGDVFFACAGQRSDGRHYLEQAYQAGAAALILEAQNADNAALATDAVPHLRVLGLRPLLGEIADAWYGQPSHALSVIAITGTNGKTSTVQWLAAALCAGQVPCGTIGTLGVMLPDGRHVPGALTTPDVLSLHRSLAQLRDAGAVAVALEASSIGIVQGRLDGVRIAFAGFTNLTHEHLDYHYDMAQYQAAKFALFAHAHLRGAVVNMDDAAGQALFARLPAAQRLGYTCRTQPEALVAASHIQATAHGQVCQLHLPDGAAQLITSVLGAHNIANLLLVAGVLHRMGWSLARVIQALTPLQAVAGRLQTVPAPQTAGAQAAPVVVVDYAHTPDALAQALRTLRQTAQATQGQLMCVLGCGGNRDTAKRPMMGYIAQTLADHMMVTSDNPRSEDPQAIAAQIVQDLSPKPLVVLARAQAILLAILQARANDVVLLAGKGHETWQEIQDVRYPFDDRQWAALALAWRAASGISTDTRTLQPGQLFVALVGDRFDGHSHLAQAAQAGAIGAVVAHVDPGVDLPQFCVGDTGVALGQMAAAWRKRYTLPLIAVTGSNGKTTTKEMLAAILRAYFGQDAVLATQGNLNNAVGVPLTLLRLGAQHRAAVMELGMNHPGEIAVLAAMAQPDVVLVNNAQREHQEFMGSVHAVAQENGTAILALPPQGVAIYPAGDDYTPLWDTLAPDCKRLRFTRQEAASARAACDIYADAVVLQAEHIAFRLHLPETEAIDVRLAITGAHNIHNALAAAACAHAIGVPARAIAQGLAQFRPVAGRMRLLAYRGMQLIDDSYNANPDSVRAAIDALAQLQGARILVLGDMGEVGAECAAAHAEVGTYARTRGIEHVFTLGDACTHACAAFGIGAQGFDSVAALVHAVNLAPPAHVLVKGSRFMRMERVVQALQAANGDSLCS